mgnify:CR=1 FL=1
MGGTSEIDGSQWVTSMGHFQGLFDKDWLGIPATRKMAFLRYAEFHNVKDGKIVRSSFFCDIIGVMHQAGINPLPMQTGASVTVPGPKTQDGILIAGQPKSESQKTMAVLNQMIADLNELNRLGEGRFPPEILERTWHSDMSWYGPAGIGSTYTVRRYQEQHSFPFREALKGIFLMSFIAGLVSIVVNFVFYKFIEPGAYEKISEIVTQNLSTTYEKLGMDQATIDKTIPEVLEKMKAQFDPSFTDVLKNLGIAVLIQFVMSLIFAAIFKKEQPIFTSTEE